MNSREYIDAENYRLFNQYSIIENNLGKCPEEIIAMSCQNLCVSISGSLEQCLLQITKEYAEKHCGEKFKGLIDELNRKFQNPKPEKILDTIGLIDKQFTEDLNQSWIKDDREKTQLYILVNKRNDIAHCKGKRLDVTTEDLKFFLNAYRSLINKVHSIILD